MNTVQYINEQQAKLDRIEKELLAAEKVLRILSSARNKLSELPQEEQKYEVFTSTYNVTKTLINDIYDSCDKLSESMEDIRVYIKLLNTI